MTALYYWCLSQYKKEGTFGLMLTIMDDRPLKWQSVVDYPKTNTL